MTPLVLVFALGAPANVSVHASPASCVSADDVARALPPIPPAANARILIDDHGADLSLRLGPERTLERHVDAPCDQLPAVTARVVERFLAALPEEAWQAPAAPAATTTAPQQAAPAPTRGEASPLRASASASLETDAGFGTARMSLVPEATLVLSSSPPFHVAIYGDGRVSTELYLLQQLGTRSIVATSALVGGGVGLGARDEGVVQLGARAGVVDIMTSDGQAQVVPALDIVGAVVLRFGWLLVRGDASVPLVRPVLHAPGVAAVTTSPVFIGIGLGVVTDLPLPGNSGS